MSMLDRAAQFSPFAALVGYEAEKVELDRRVGILAAHLREKPVVTVEYFVPDTLKSGGAYVFKSGALVRISPVKKTLTLADGTSIRFKDVVGIDSGLFLEGF